MNDINSMAIGSCNSIKAASRIALCAGLVAVMGSTAAGDVVSDARTILDAKNGTVTKWATGPKVAVLHSGDIDRQAFRETLAEIERHTSLPGVSLAFVDMDAVVDDGKFHDTTDFRIRQTGDRTAMGEMRLGGSPEVVEANLFVFAVPNRYVAHFMVLTDYGLGGENLSREYVRGTGPCYFSTFSRGGSIHVGLVFISPGIDADFFARCVHEELYQAMGLPNDAVDSEVFNFDNRAEDKDPRYDHALLASLYDSRIAPGDAVEDVLDIFREKLGDR